MKRLFLIILLPFALVLPALAQEIQNVQQQQELPQRVSSDLELFNDGYRLLLEGNSHCKEAIDKFSELEQKYPKSSYLDRALFWKAWCHSELKNYGTAIKIYEEVAAKYKNSAYVDDALFKIGDIYENALHDYDKAIGVYERLVKEFAVEPDLSNINFSSNGNLSQNVIIAQQQKAQIEERNQNFSQALNDWEDSQSLNKKYHPRRGTNDYFDRRAQARVDFIKNNRDNDYLPLTKFTLGQALKKEGKHQEAIGKFRELQKEFPDSSLADDAQYEIALCLQELNKIGESREALEIFLEKYDQSELNPEIQKKLSKLSSRDPIESNNDTKQ